jgi:hypothetical protein
MVWRILEIAAYSHGRSYGHFFPRASNPKPRIKSRICENHVQGPDPPVEALGTTDLYGSKWGYQPSMGSLTYTCYRLL